MSPTVEYRAAAVAQFRGFSRNRLFGDPTTGQPLPLRPTCPEVTVKPDGTGSIVKALLPSAASRTSWCRVMPDNRTAC